MNEQEAGCDKEQLLARWVVSHADQVLSSVEAVLDDPLRLAKKLRKQFDVERTRAICSLAEVRRRATVKFANADRMFFTSLGFEQSTSQAIASYKARRFSALSTRSIVDLCCGIGGDANWLSENAELTLVDLSATCVEFSLANLKVHGRVGQGITEDIRRVNLDNFDAWHIDPDRRVEGNRRSSPDLCEPPLSEFLSMPGLSPNGAIKLSPAADASHLLELGAELEWIGCQQECRQQVAWFGDLAMNPGKRTASWILGKQREEHASVESLVEESTSRETLEVVNELDEYLYEPRASVIAAGLTDELGQQLSLKRLHGVNYLTSATSHHSQMLQRFRVLESGPFRKNALVQRLRDMKVRASEVKKRGVAIDPESLLRHLSNNAGESVAPPVTVILFPQDQSIRYAITQREERE